MNEDFDRKVSEKLKEGLDGLEKNIRVSVPDINQFRQLVSQVEEKKKARSNMEFYIFVLVAFVFLTATFCAYSSSFVIFAVVQAVSLIIIPTVILFGYRKQSRKVKA